MDIQNFIQALTTEEIKQLHKALHGTHVTFVDPKITSITPKEIKINKDGTLNYTGYCFVYDTNDIYRCIINFPRLELKISDVAVGGEGITTYVPYLSPRVAYSLSATEQSDNVLFTLSFDED